MRIRMRSPERAPPRVRPDATKPTPSVPRVSSTLMSSCFYVARRYYRYGRYNGSLMQNRARGDHHVFTGRGGAVWGWLSPRPASCVVCPDFSRATRVTVKEAVPH